MKQKVWSFLRVIIGIAILMFLVRLIDNYNDRQEQLTYEKNLKVCETIIQMYNNYENDNLCTFDNDEKSEKYFSCIRNLHDENFENNLKQFCKDAYDDVFDKE